MNSIYQCLYDRAKAIIKKDTTMAFYNKKGQLYIDTDASGLGLRPSLLYLRDGMQFPRNEAPYNAAFWPVAFATKSLMRAQTLYNNILREAPCMLLGLEKFHYYCFIPNISAL